MQKQHKTFIGKAIPKPHTLKQGPGKPRFGSSWMLLFSAPVLLFLGLSLTTPLTTTGSAQTESNALRQVRVFGTASQPASCDTVATSDIRLFPIIPDSFRDPDGCNPQGWNRRIFAFLAYKVLAIANYLAGAIAIIATVYGGILYLGGFAGEENVKRAKSIIIGAYVGFAIVLLARLVVQGSFYFFGDGSTDLSNPLDDKELTQ
ncbi:hypothetical protein BH11PAT4_BH11PAT4_1890 [soil metagenome]